MKKIEGGATIWARQTIESDVFLWKPDKWFKIWFFIVNKVNHKDNKQFKRGEGFMTYEDIQHGTKATRGQVDTFIRWSKLHDMLTTRKTTRGMIVKLPKYAYFQTLSNYYDKADTTAQSQSTRNINDTIYKNGIKKEDILSDKSDISLKEKEERKELKDQFITLVKKKRSFDYTPTGQDMIRMNIVYKQKGYKLIKNIFNWYITTKKSEEHLTMTSALSEHSLNLYEQEKAKKNWNVV